MAGNLLVDQGVLQRVRASISWVNAPELNITASFLGRDAIRLALDGETTVYLPTMTGAVTSREPYMMITVTAHLLKTQPLADAYKARWEVNANLGNGTVRPDVPAGTGIGPFDIMNCSISGIRELDFSGASADLPISFRGYYLINSSLFD